MRNKKLVSLKEIIESNLVPEDFRVRSRYFKSVASGNLSKLEKDIKHPNENVMSDDMIEGSIVDMLLTESEEAVNDKFHFVSALGPTEKTKLFVDAVISNSKAMSVDITDELIISTAKEVGFNSNLKDATLVTKFNEWGYYVEERLAIPEGKILSTMDTFHKCSVLAESVRSNDVTGDIFNTGRRIYKPLLSLNYADILKVYLKDSGITIPDNFSITLMSELDFIYVNDEGKFITPFEIKTYGDNLMTSYYRFKYYYQLAIYSLILQELITTNSQFAVDNNLIGYKVMTPMILGINKGYEDIPRLYAPTNEHLIVAIVGGTLAKTIKPIKGWVELSLEFLWHVVNDEYTYPKDVVENNYIEIIE